MNSLLRLIFAGGLGLASVVLGASAWKHDPASSITYAASATEQDKWSGKAPVEKLDLDFNPAKPLETNFTVTVRPERFSSGNGIRDGNARDSVFEVQKFPEIRLSSLEVRGTATAMRSGESREFRARSRLSMRGVNKDLELPVTVRLEGRKLTALSAFSIELDDFKMNRPQMLWLKVDNLVRLEVKLTANLE